jgi:predicted nucleotidyltransferase
MINDESIRKLIGDIVEKIKEVYSPQKIILFGSYASGQPREDSDIDLLIIKETDQKPMERWLNIRKSVRDISRKTVVSPFVYTPAEIEQRFKLGDFFLKRILEEGELLYERKL